MPENRGTFRWHEPDAAAPAHVRLVKGGLGETVPPGGCAAKLPRTGAEP